MKAFCEAEVVALVAKQLILAQFRKEFCSKVEGGACQSADDEDPWHASADPWSVPYCRGSGDSTVEKIVETPEVLSDPWRGYFTALEKMVGRRLLRFQKLV